MADITNGVWVNEGNPVDSVYKYVKGENLLAGTSDEFVTVTGTGWGSARALLPAKPIDAVGDYTVSYYVENAPTDMNFYINVKNHVGNFFGTGIEKGKSGYVVAHFSILEGQSVNSAWVGFAQSQTETYTYRYKEVMMVKGAVQKQWSPAPVDFKVYGRNLVQKTNSTTDFPNMETMSVSAGHKTVNPDGSVTVVSTTDLVEMYYRFINPNAQRLAGLIPGKTYTFSGRVKGTLTDGRVLSNRSQYQSPKATGWQVTHSDIILNGSSSDYVDFTTTYTVPEDATAFYFSINENDPGATDTFTFKDISLTEGTGRAPHSPAPEDYGIYNRNLLLDSKTQSSDSWYVKNKDSTETYMGTNVYTGTLAWIGSKYSFKDLVKRNVINKEDTFVFSAYFKYVGIDFTKLEATDNLRFYSTVTNASNTGVIVDFSTIPADTWTRVQVPFKFTTLDVTKASDGNAALRFETTQDLNSNGHFCFAGYQLEKGVIAHTYHPAPEDN